MDDLIYEYSNGHEWITINYSIEGDAGIIFEVEEYAENGNISSFIKVPLHKIEELIKALQTIKKASQ